MSLYSVAVVILKCSVMVGLVMFVVFSYVTIRGPAIKDEGQSGKRLAEVVRDMVDYHWILVAAVVSSFFLDLETAGILVISMVAVRYISAYFTGLAVVVAGLCGMLCCG